MSAPFVLPASLDLTAADALHGDVLAWLAEHDQLIVDGGAVERVSTACLQVLAAAARQRRCAVRAASSVLRQAITDLGLGGLLAREDAWPSGS